MGSEYDIKIDPSITPFLLQMEIYRELQESKKKQMKYYNIGSKTLPKITVGQTVRIQPSVVGEKRWKKAVCIA